MILSLLLTILKFIGILLGAIFVLLLFLTCLILFVPIVYNIHVQKDENLPPAGRARVSWLFRLVSFSYEFAGNKGSETIRIFGIKLGKKEKAKAKAKKTAVKKPKPTPKQKPKPKPESPPYSASKARKEPPAKEKRNVETERLQETEKAKPAYDTDSVKVSDALKPPAASDIKKNPSKNASEGISKKEKPKKEKKSRTKEKDGGIWAKIQAFRDFEHKKEIFQQVKLLIQRLIRSLTHGRLNAYLKVGTGEPDTTGYVLALCYMLSGTFGLDINAEGDFEEMVLEGNINAQGRIFLCTIVLAVLRFALSKYIWPVIKKEIFAK